jgi:hypothetical protein
MNTNNMHNQRIRSVNNRYQRDDPRDVFLRRAALAPTEPQHELSDGTDEVTPPPPRLYNRETPGAFPAFGLLPPPTPRLLTPIEQSEILRVDDAYLYEEPPLVPATIVEEQTQRQDKCLPNPCTIL